MKEKHLLSEHFKLYGMTIAALPRHDGTTMMDVTCTSIAVAKGKRDSFETLNDLSFKMAVDAGSPEQLAQCFGRAVSTLESVVTLQEKSLNEYGLPYRSVCFYIGDSAKQPVNLDALFTQMFGERFLQPLTPKEVKTHTHEIFASENADMEINPIFIPMMAEPAVKEALAKNKQHEAQIRKAEKCTMAKARTAPVFAGYAQSSKKLADLLDKCVLDRGRISSNVDSRVIQQGAIDRQVLQLQADLKAGDNTAHDKLIKIARHIGRALGEQANESPYIFVMAAPPGYREDKTAQKKFPRWSFYYDDPAYKEAFYKGYKETYRGTYTHTLKLPLDPPEPPYTTPCADRIRDQIEIAEGTRAGDAYFDLTPERKKIMKAATKLSDGKWATGSKQEKSAASVPGR